MDTTVGDKIINQTILPHDGNQAPSAEKPRIGANTNQDLYTRKAGASAVLTPLPKNLALMVACSPPGSPPILPPVERAPATITDLQKFVEKSNIASGINDANNPYIDAPLESWGQLITQAMTIMMQNAGQVAEGAMLKIYLGGMVENMFAMINAQLTEARIHMDEMNAAANMLLSAAQLFENPNQQISDILAATDRPGLANFREDKNQDIDNILPSVKPDNAIHDTQMRKPLHDHLRANFILNKAGIDVNSEVYKKQLDGEVLSLSPGQHHTWATCYEVDPKHLTKNDTIIVRDHLGNFLKRTILTLDEIKSLSQADQKKYHEQIKTFNYVNLPLERLALIKDEHAHVQEAAEKAREHVAKTGQGREIASKLEACAKHLQNEIKNLDKSVQLIKNHIKGQDAYNQARKTIGKLQAVMDDFDAAHDKFAAKIKLTENRIQDIKTKQQDNKITPEEAQELQALELKNTAYKEAKTLMQESTIHTARRMETLGDILVSSMSPKESGRFYATRMIYFHEKYKNLEKALPKKIEEIKNRNGPQEEIESLKRDVAAKKIYLEKMDRVAPKHCLAMAKLSYIYHAQRQKGLTDKDIADDLKINHSDLLEKAGKAGIIHNLNKALLKRRKGSLEVGFRASNLPIRTNNDTNLLKEEYVYICKRLQVQGYEQYERDIIANNIEKEPETKIQKDTLSEQEYQTYLSSRIDSEIKRQPDVIPFDEELKFWKEQPLFNDKKIGWSYNIPMAFPDKAKRQLQRQDGAHVMPITKHTDVKQHHDTSGHITQEEKHLVEIHNQYYWKAFAYNTMFGEDSYRDFHAEHLQNTASSARALNQGLDQFDNLTEEASSKATDTTAIDSSIQNSLQKAQDVYAQLFDFFSTINKYLADTN